MDFKEISDLVKLVGKSNLIQLKIKKGDFELSLRTDKHGDSKSDEPAVLTTPMQAAIVQPAPPVTPAPPAQVMPVPQLTVDATAESQAPADDGGEYLEIKSPMVGTFYRSSSPDKPPYVKVGDGIQQGSVVCIIEAMKLFNEIESEISGTIVKVMVEDATPVEYDQVLFLVEK